MPPFLQVESISLQVLCSNLWDRLAAGNPGLQRQAHKTSGEHQAEARPHCDYYRAGRARMEANAQHAQDRQ